MPGVMQACIRSRQAVCCGWLCAGLDVLRHAVHGSGSPVPWDIERGADHRELLAVVHTRHGASAHWAARIDRATHRMTHISAGPVLRSADYYTKVCGAAL
jgi:hypothetical protein